MNSNLKSVMMQTLKGNELDFFQNLEKQYFLKAIKTGSSKSPSVDDLQFPSN